MSFNYYLQPSFGAQKEIADTLYEQIVRERKLEKPLVSLSQNIKWLNPAAFLSAPLPYTNSFVQTFPLFWLDTRQIEEIRNRVQTLRPYDAPN
jgi:hypothetical protein